MKFKVFVFILLLSSVSVFSQTKDEALLKTLVKQMTDAQVNYEPNTLDKIFASDYIEISPVGELDTREKVIGFYKPEMKPPTARRSTVIEATDFSIRNYGNFAIVIARLNIVITSDGKTKPPLGMRATLVCKKEKGAWRIASAQYTGIRPPNTTKPE